jgi:hypothetical protein
MLTILLNVKQYFLSNFPSLIKTLDRHTIKALNQQVKERKAAQREEKLRIQAEMEAMQNILLEDEDSTAIKVSEK